jgi:hypothetical protein
LLLGKGIGFVLDALGLPRMQLPVVHIHRRGPLRALNASQRCAGGPRLAQPWLRKVSTEGRHGPGIRAWPSIHPAGT